jgi:hypothetical protein
MKIYKVINKNISSLLRNNRLNLSGEINVLSIDIKKAIMIDEDIYGNLIKNAESLKRKFKFINISTEKELHELNIKLIAIDKLFLDDGFLEDLVKSINELVTDVSKTNGLKIRINFFGDIKTWYRTEKYIIVNNNMDVYFKIIEVREHYFIFPVIGKFVDKVLLKKIF